MIAGVVVGIVEDNVDPEQMHRVLVRYPVQSDDKVQSTWARVCSPMAGVYRGLVMLPDVGTEVAIGFSQMSHTAYVLGAVYNGGEDRPEPYHNDDTTNSKRVFWSRSDHMLIFDDTPAMEKVQFAASAPMRLLARTGAIHQTLDSSQKRIKEYCSGDTIWEAQQKISLKCTDFRLTASQSVQIGAGNSACIKSSQSTSITSAGEQRYNAAQTAINPGRESPEPAEAMQTPEYYHAPYKL